MNARTPLPIRRAEAADAAAITACVQAAYRLYIPRMGKAPGPMLDDYAEVVRHQRVFVAPAAPATSGHVEIAGVLVLKPGKDGILLENVTGIRPRCALDRFCRGRSAASWLHAS